MVTSEQFRRAAAAAMSEDQLLAEVRELAATFGWMTYHTHDSRRSEPGFPDLVLIRGDRVLYRELKTNRGRLTPEQSAWLGALNEAGCEGGLWRPADLFSGQIRDTLKGHWDARTALHLEVLAHERARKGKRR